MITHFVYIVAMMAVAYGAHTRGARKAELAMFLRFAVPLGRALKRAQHGLGVEMRNDILHGRDHVTSRGYQRWDKVVCWLHMCIPDGMSRTAIVLTAIQEDPELRREIEDWTETP